MRSKRFHAAFDDADIEGLVYEYSILNILPQSDAKILARHNLQSRMAWASPRWALQWYKYEDLEVAIPVLEEEAKSSDANERLTSLQYFIECAYRNETNITEMFEYIQRIKNEQDPVR